MFSSNLQHAKLQNFLPIKPTLKSCSFPIRWLGEIKSHEPPMGRNFFLKSLSKKIQKDLKRQAVDTIKILLCICLYSIFIFSFYVDSL